MKLWLLCFVLIFAAAEGLQGLGGWPNLGAAPLWHPLTVLAGIGLAVLSNAKALGLGSNSAPSSTQAMTPPPENAPTPVLSAPPAPATAVPPTQASPVSPVSPKTKGRRRAKVSSDSISFEIRKPS